MPTEIKDEGRDPRIIELQATEAEVEKIYRFRPDGSFIGTEIRLKPATAV